VAAGSLSGTRATSAGVADERIEFAPRVPADEYRALFGKVDIALEHITIQWRDHHIGRPLAGCAGSNTGWVGFRFPFFIQYLELPGINRLGGK